MIEIPYKKAKADFPQQTKSALQKLRASRSNKRKARPGRLKWRYHWAIICGSNSFDEVLDGTAYDEDQAYCATGKEERVSDMVARSTVLVSVHRHWYYAKLPTVPEEVVEIIRETVGKEIDEERRIAAMTPEARQAKVDSLLGELRGPGFAEIGMSGASATRSSGGKFRISSSEK